MSTEKERRFPIQRAGTVSWEAAEKAYAAYSKQYGTQQSLERLAERAGFGILEFCSLYLGMRNDHIAMRTLVGKEHIIARVAAELGDKWIFPEKILW